MNTSKLVIGMLAAACLMAAAPTVSAEGACNNYGVQVQFWIEGGNCNVQECYMGTGAAAGVGKAGVSGDGDMGAEASAGGNCEQGSGGDCGAQSETQTASYQFTFVHLVTLLGECL